MPTDSTTDARKNVVLQLAWDDIDGRVIVTPENEDRYQLRIDRVVELLQLAQDAESFKNQVNFLHKRLAGWMSARDDIENAYLTFRDGALSLVVVRNDPKYCPEFDDALSDLDIEIANDVDLNLIKLNTISLPPTSQEALQQFVDDNFCFLYSRGN